MKPTTRANWMMTACFIGIFVSVGILAYFRFDAGSATGTLLIVIATKFLGNWGSGFDWEFGSSKQDAGNQQALRDAASTPPPAGTVTVTPQTPPATTTVTTGPKP